MCMKFCSYRMDSVQYRAGADPAVDGRRFDQKQKLRFSRGIKFIHIYFFSVITSMIMVILI